MIFLKVGSLLGSVLENMFYSIDEYIENWFFYQKISIFSDRDF